MHLIVHICKKDVRRLSWGIAVALLIQIAAAWFDAVGAIVVPLQLLLVVTWAALVALAVDEDPQVGDRQFWITRPARWRVMLGSKLLFALAVVHVPSFLADITVLAVRGFRPWEWLASLLSKQILLAATLTLPMIAMAAVLRNFAHLALAVIGIVGLTIFASNFTPSSLEGRWIDSDQTRYALMATVVGVGASFVVWWQYARRRSWRARSVGVLSVLAAEAVFALLSPLFVARARAAVDPVRERISFHLRNSVQDINQASNGMPRFGSPPGFVAMSVPLEVTGIPGGLRSMFGAPSVEIIGPVGQRYHAVASYIANNWLILAIPLGSYERLKDVIVELKSAVPTILYRVGSVTSLPVGVDRTVPGAGRCSTELFELPGLNPGERHSFVRITCESPTGSPLPALVKFWEFGPAPLEVLGESARTAQLDWRNPPSLSPLAR